MLIAIKAGNLIGFPRKRALVLCQTEIVLYLKGAKTINVKTGAFEFEFVAHCRHHRAWKLTFLTLRIGFGQ